MTDTEYLTIPHLSTSELTYILSKISIGHESGCWITLSNHNQQGYGRLNFRGRQELAHRVMYAWLVGPVPRRKRGEAKDGWLELDHVICSNPPCCNPAHLKLVTTKENCLRGRSPIALNAKKTHCANGHLLPHAPNRCSKGRWRRRCIPCQRQIEKLRPPRPYREIPAKSARNC